MQPVGRAWIRGAVQRTERIAAVLRREHTGKSSAALAADARRKSRRMFPIHAHATGCLPTPPLRTASSMSKGPQWPANGFEPVPDRGMIETFTVGRLPDGWSGLAPTIPEKQRRIYVGARAPQQSSARPKEGWPWLLPLRQSKPDGARGAASRHRLERRLLGRERRARSRPVLDRRHRRDRRHPIGAGVDAVGAVRFHPGLHLCRDRGPVPKQIGRRLGLRRGGKCVIPSSWPLSVWCNWLAWTPVRIGCGIAAGSFSMPCLRPTRHQDLGGPTPRSRLPRRRGLKLRLNSTFFPPACSPISPGELERPACCPTSHMSRTLPLLRSAT